MVDPRFAIVLTIVVLISLIEIGKHKDKGNAFKNRPISREYNEFISRNHYIYTRDSERSNHADDSSKQHGRKDCICQHSANKISIVTENVENWHRSPATPTIKDRPPRDVNHDTTETENTKQSVRHEKSRVDDETIKIDSGNDFPSKEDAQKYSERVDIKTENAYQTYDKSDSSWTGNSHENVQKTRTANIRHPFLNDFESFDTREYGHAEVDYSDEESDSEQKTLFTQSEFPSGYLKEFKFETWKSRFGDFQNGNFMVRARNDYTVTKQCSTDGANEKTYSFRSGKAEDFTFKYMTYPSKTYLAIASFPRGHYNMYIRAVTNYTGKFNSNLALAVKTNSGPVLVTTRFTSHDIGVIWYDLLAKSTAYLVLIYTSEDINPDFIEIRFRMTLVRTPGF